MQTTAKNAFRNLKQGGFTLIELMIVVAIIGVLASIAVPQYQNYVGRAQAAEAFTATAGIRTDIAVYYAENGSFLGYTSSGGSANFNQGSAGALDGQYIGEVSLNGTQNGAYSVEFDAGVHEGETIVFTPLIDGSPATVDDASSSAGGQISGWQCTGLDATYLPAACRK